MGVTTCAAFQPGEARHPNDSDMESSSRRSPRADLKDARARQQRDHSGFWPPARRAIAKWIGPSEAFAEQRPPTTNETINALKAKAAAGGHAASSHPNQLPNCGLDPTVLDVQGVIDNEVAPR